MAVKIADPLLLIHGMADDNVLFTATRLGGIALANRVVMAPLTRNRALPDRVPTPLAVEYYGQRAGAGLIITEGTSPSPNGLGYPRIPGLFNPAHVAGWRKVTAAVHARGARIFVQLMHTGRVAHPDNLPAGAEDAVERWLAAYRSSQPAASARKTQAQQG